MIVFRVGLYKSEGDMVGYGTQTLLFEYTQDTWKMNAGKYAKQMLKWIFQQMFSLSERGQVAGEVFCHHHCNTGSATCLRFHRQFNILLYFYYCSTSAYSNCDSYSMSITSNEQAKTTPGQGRI